jgi:glycosyltransferase involved in cell wall biosynthesis
MPGMSVSVVIPTRDRLAKLSRCLAAVAGQADEIVVVDDGSSEPQLVADLARDAGAQLVRLEGRGPAAARNAGAGAASGRVVCFTDDDCEPQPGWVEALAAPILSGEALCTAGRTRVGDDASAADRAWQAIANHLQRAAAEPGSPSPGFAPTCNLACPRELLAELPFDESFPVAAGEDRDWATRVAVLGAAPRLVPGAVVVHRPQLGPIVFLRQQYRYGRGAARYRRAARGRRIGPAGFYIGLLRAGFAAGPATGLLVLAAQLATATGVLAEGQRSSKGSPARS